ncbi:hypothetical protein PAAG_05702 [Paracoccidioides lutzii Pb01]|uniref:Dpy-30 domain-containing protein n=1 Tax=Paracoccidioides lutzii (strain ATCC MYA-826 / Pb01) TaxID=502779 RepID=C1H4K9_PARBA|nr:hypothetical protein PAAG_05702 [Paracoccidioides lutzii Pb01]EEH34653.2 hypothetical protein PAAG_05702 [Paracoccidioides lutzii Pb01]
MLLLGIKRTLRSSGHPSAGGQQRTERLTLSVDCPFTARQTANYAVTSAQTRQTRLRMLTRCHVLEGTVFALSAITLNLTILQLLRDCGSEYTTRTSKSLPQAVQVAGILLRISKDLLPIPGQSDSHPPPSLRRQPRIPSLPLHSKAWRTTTVRATASAPTTTTMRNIDSPSQHFPEEAVHPLHPSQQPAALPSTSTTDATTDEKHVTMSGGGLDNNSQQQQQQQHQQQQPLPTTTAAPATSSNDINMDTRNASAASISQVRPGGAPARVYMNEKIVPYLLEGMKTLAKEQPSNPLRVLGEYLLQKSSEIGE